MNGWPTLSGARNLVNCETHTQARDLVAGLMVCEEHKGIHHLAVIGEGLQLAMSDLAVDCLTKQGLLIFNGTDDA